VADPESLQYQAFKKHEKHTSGWLLRSKEWNEWLHGNDYKRLLWIHGIPGAGKTVLASFIIDHLMALCKEPIKERQQPCFITYYYCHYTNKHHRGNMTGMGYSQEDAELDTAHQLLKWIIGELCWHTQKIPTTLLKDFYDKNRNPNMQHLEEMLETALASFDGTCYLVIDAVDESSPRRELLHLISALSTDDARFGNLRILATSRLYADINDALLPISTTLPMSNHLVDDDIRKFVRSRLHSNRLLRSLPFASEIEERLVAGANGMFRWAECQLYAIERLRTERQIREALANLPPDLIETYRRLFENIPKTDWLFVRRIFIWINGHGRAAWLVERGINANVLLSAVNHELRYEYKYTVDDLRELCGCLISIHSHKSPKAVSGTTTSTINTCNNTPATNVEARDLFVSLAHYTVWEFLESDMIKTFAGSPGVSEFALSGREASREFRKSVLGQAIAAEPCGDNDGASDWITDREAYCLTLSAGSDYLFDEDDIDDDDDDDVADTAIQYFDPSAPHFSRIKAIQERIYCLPRDHESSCYFIRRLAVEVQPREHTSSTDRDSLAAKRGRQAAILLNLLLSSMTRLAKRFIAGKNLADLMSTELSVTLVERARHKSHGEENDLGSSASASSSLKPWLSIREGTIYDIADWHPILSVVLKWLKLERSGGYVGGNE